MKIAVLIKQTPDTAELPKVSVAEAQSGDIKATMVINPWDEYAAEEAIDLADRFDADSVAISLGMEGETDALKHALAMGVNTPMRKGEAHTARCMRKFAIRFAAFHPETNTVRKRFIAVSTLNNWHEVLDAYYPAAARS